MGSSPSAPARPSERHAKAITLGLHVGAHKTATTHLQTTLRENSDVIREGDIAYYGPISLRKPGQSLRHVFGLLAPVEGTPDRTPVEQLEFMAKGAHRVVASDENFWGTLHDHNGQLQMPIYPQALNRLSGLSEAIAPHTLQLFLCVREPCGLLASGHGQALLGDRRVTLDDYLGGASPLDLKWSDLVRRMTQVPNVAEIYVWTYEQYRTIAPLVFRRLLRWKVGPKIKFFDGKVHPGLSARAVEAALDPDQSGTEDGFADRAREAFPVGKKWGRYAPFAPSLVKESRAAYLDDLLTIADMPGVTLMRPKIKAKGLVKKQAAGEA